MSVSHVMSKASEAVTNCSAAVYIACSITYVNDVCVEHTSTVFK